MLCLRCGIREVRRFISRGRRRSPRVGVAGEWVRRMTTDDRGAQPDRPVLIVGAGPTGLVLAIELARRGIATHLIDRMAEPAPWSAAIYIKSRTLEILADLGLVDRFLERGERVHGVKVFLGSEEVAAFPFDVIDSPYPYILSIPETDTIALLTEELESLSGTVDRGVEFVGLENGNDGVRVRLRCEERGEYERDVQWVVGTDGYHSAVRDAIGDQFDGVDHPQLWGVFDTETHQLGASARRYVHATSTPDRSAISTRKIPLAHLLHRRGRRGRSRRGGRRAAGPYLARRRIGECGGSAILPRALARCPAL